MFPKVILNITSCVYWDFFSTLSAIILGIFCTWLFSKHYYSKTNEYSKKLSAILGKKISELTKRKFKIEHDKKGMPMEVVFIPISGKLNMKSKLKAEKIKVKNNDN